MNLQLFLRIVVIAILAVSWQANLIALPQDNSDITVTGKYSNYDYAYSVEVPAGRSGFRSPSPNPNHGFSIRLDPVVDADLWVDASYNSILWKGLNEAVDAESKYLVEDGATHVVLRARQSVHLGGLRAMRVKLQYTRARGDSMIVDITLAMRNPRVKGEVGIVYSLSLRAPVGRYDRYSPMLSKMLSSFRLSRLP